LFTSSGEVDERLREAGYVPNPQTSTIVHLATRLQKPVLVEGPAGTGKTELAKCVAQAVGARLIRLQCYEGLDEAKALYEWDYRRQLLHIQLHNNELSSESTEEAEADLFSEHFLLTRPLLEAIRSPELVVLLIDEVDRLDIETEALLLEVLSDYQVSIPELGTVTAKRIPIVFLTSNNTRELSEAVRRRCLYLHIDYPSVEREHEIVTARVPEASANLANQLAQVMGSLRSLELKKKPSVSEALDWARTLVVLGIDQIDNEVLAESLPILLKHQVDIDLAIKELGRRPREAQ
jgi:MoxR-like ATPase